MKIIKVVYFFLFYALTLSFFLSIGADYPAHIHFRMLLGGAVFLAGIFVVDRSKWHGHPIKLCAFFMMAFLGFIVLRALWAFVCHSIFHTPASETFPYTAYLKSPIRWAYCVILFLLSGVTFYDRKKTYELSFVMILGALFIALNAIPAQLIYKSFGYEVATGEFRFFYPGFYFHPWISRYLLSPLSHPNFVGDFISFGFFPALGVSLYALFDILDPHTSRDSEDEPKSILLSRSLLFFVLGMISFAAILLLFSRGTMVSVGLSLGVFVLFLLAKYPKKRFAKGVALIFLIGIPFLFWAGNLKKAWHEIQTLDKEMEGVGSIEVTEEGIKRGLGMFKDYPIWGAGSENYANLSLKYSTPGINSTSYYLAQFQTTCHYVHLMAEEGVGGIIYAFFIIIYLCQMIRLLVLTKSRFKFLMGLSFFCAVVSILIHASINDLMQRFSTSMLTYVMMGASLAMLRESKRDHRSSGLIEPSAV